MDEVPGPQAALLALDEQQALAGEDEEVLLLVLAVVHARGLAGREHADVDPEAREALVPLEAGERAEGPVEPPLRLAGVHDEPPLAYRNEARLR
jgi:hypothetical protein